MDFTQGTGSFWEGIPYVILGGTPGPPNITQNFHRETLEFQQEGLVLFINYCYFNFIYLFIYFFEWGGDPQYYQKTLELQHTACIQTVLTPQIRRLDFCPFSNRTSLNLMF
jgi:hypothetical protein